MPSGLDFRLHGARGMACWLRVLPGTVGLALLLIGAGNAQAEVALTTELKAITAAVDGLSGKLLTYVALLTAVSTLAMALWESVKAICDTRCWFHRRRIEAWLGGHHAVALPELLFLAIGTRDHFYVLTSQELSKMMGQIQAAARVALDYPDKFAKAYAFFTDTDLKLELAEAYKGESGQHVATTDSAQWMQAAAKGRAAILAPNADPADAAAAAQARARLSNLVSRKLDGFQLRTDFWWSRLNQLASMVISVGLMFYAIGLVQSSNLWFGNIALGLISGLLAPFMKDLTQSIASLKARVSA